MKLREAIFSLFTSPAFTKWVIFLRPHHFIIRFYRLFFLFFSSSENPVLKIASGYGRNIKMSFRMKDASNPQEIYYWLGFHEPDVQRLFAKIIKPGFIVYDIGAYIGFYSLLAARLTGATGKVYLFEPFPGNAERIRLNISLNGMQDRVFCIPKAVMAESTKVLCCYSNRKDWTRVVDYGDSYLAENSLLTEAVSLDDFIFQKNYPPADLIKIDTEGNEGKILAGARRFLKTFKPLIICEVHTLEAAKQVYDELAHLGYRFEDTNGRSLATISKQHILVVPKERLI